MQPPSRIKDEATNNNKLLSALCLRPGELPLPVSARPDGQRALCGPPAA